MGRSRVWAVYEWVRMDKRPNGEEVTPFGARTKVYWAQWKTLAMRDNILYRKWEEIPLERSSWLVRVHDQFKTKILDQVHGTRPGGHLGKTKTTSRVRRRFYWVNMGRDVQNWCRSCDACTAKKGPARRMRAPLQLHQVGAPLERVAMDILGPLPPTRQGNK